MAIEKGRINSKSIILDTSEYAGNFEREICAYITGQVGDYGVGEEIANQSDIKNLTWWNENINPQEVEEGSDVFIPCTIVKTPEDNKLIHQLNYNSVAIFVEEFPNQEVMQELMTKAKYFCQNRKEIYEQCGYYKSNSENKIQLLNIRMVEPIVEKVLVEKEKVVSEKTIKSFKF